MADFHEVRSFECEADLESSFSVSTNTTKIIRNLLAKGKLSIEEIMEVAEVDRDEVERVQSAMSTEGNSMSAEKAKEVEEKLSSYPEPFLCSKTRELMCDPVVDPDGNSFERGAEGGAIEVPRNPNTYLKTKIEEFKHERIRKVIAEVPGLASAGSEAAAMRLLALAGGLAKSLPDGEDLRREVLELSARLPAEQRPLPAELVSFLVHRRQYPELARRFQELQIAALPELLSREQATSLYAEVRALAECDSGEASRAARVAAGRLLLTKLGPETPAEVAGKPGEEAQGVGGQPGPHQGHTEGAAGDGQQQQPAGEGEATASGQEQDGQAVPAVEPEEGQQQESQECQKGIQTEGQMEGQEVAWGRGQQESLKQGEKEDPLESQEGRQEDSPRGKQEGEEGQAGGQREGHEMQNPAQQGDCHEYFEGRPELANERKQLLLELYAVEPALDFCSGLASLIVSVEPLAQLEETLASLPAPVLEAAATYAKSSTHLPSVRASTALVAVAELSSQQEAMDLYRSALEAQPACSKARKGLMELLLRDLEAGTNMTDAAKVELAQLLVSQSAILKLAQHFGTLRASTELHRLDPPFALALAEALQTSGRAEYAAEAAVAAAEKMEAAGKQHDALQAFRKAFECNAHNASAAAGMQRLSAALDQEWEAAASLLMSAMKPDPTAAEHLLAAMNLLHGHFDKRVHSLEEEVGALRAQALEDKKAMNEMKATAEAIVKKVANLDMEMETKAPKKQVRLSGFKHQLKLNTVFYCDEADVINGRETYWSKAKDSFIYKQPEGGWTVCLASVAPEHLRRIRAGTHSFVFAMKNDLDLSNPKGWQEWVGGDKWVPVEP